MNMSTKFPVFTHISQFYQLHLWYFSKIFFRDLVSWEFKDLILAKIWLWLYNIVWPNGSLVFDNKPSLIKI